MKVKQTTLQNFSIGFLLLIVGIALFVTLTMGAAETSGTPNREAVSMDGEKQIIDITAKAGYSPKLVEAKSGITTIIRVSTNNTFDCSSALTFPDLKINKNLPANGKTDIEIAGQPAGSELEGTCSMGMYSFKIRFI